MTDRVKANFIAELYPMPMTDLASQERSFRASSSANFVGVCFSGGGSRALSAAMGQLRGLKYLDVLKDVFTANYLKWQNGILEHNPKLSAKQFYCIERQRPFYVMNGSMVSDPLTDGAQLLPFESSPVAIGVRDTFPGIGPDGRDLGGGFIQPFGMGSSWLSDTPEAGYSEVSIPSRPFSLADMVGISSAAFAQSIQKSFPVLDSLVPKYNYWPVKDHALAKNTVYNYDFADGGSLEDTGITSLLNRNIPNIIAFVNSQTPLHKEDGDIVIDGQIGLLFGIAPSAASMRYKEAHREAIPNNDVTFTQVFDSSYYAAVANGLYNANAAGGAAMYMQSVPVLPNANFGIAGNYTARILWVYNTRVANWENLLTWEVRDYLKLVPNFPNYNTIYQLALGAREVNALAQLSCWNVINASGQQQIRTLFYK